MFRNIAMLTLIVLAVAVPLSAAHGQAAPPVVSENVFVRDVTTFSQALGRFGRSLQRGADGIAVLRRLAPAMRRDLRIQHRAIERMARYRVEVAGLDRKRGGIVRTGRPVVVVGGQLLDAALAQDDVRVNRIAARYTRLLNALERAAAR